MCVYLCECLYAPLGFFWWQKTYHRQYTEISWGSRAAPGASSGCAWWQSFSRKPCRCAASPLYGSACECAGSTAWAESCHRCRTQTPVWCGTSPDLRAPENLLRPWPVSCWLSGSSDACDGPNVHGVRQRTGIPYYKSVRTKERSGKITKMHKRSGKKYFLFSPRIHTLHLKLRAFSCFRACMMRAYRLWNTKPHSLQACSPSTTSPGSPCSAPSSSIVSSWSTTGSSSSAKDATASGTASMFDSEISSGLFFTDWTGRPLLTSLWGVWGHSKILWRFFCVCIQLLAHWTITAYWLSMTNNSVYDFFFKSSLMHVPTFWLHSCILNVFMLILCDLEKSLYHF